MELVHPMNQADGLGTQGVCWAWQALPDVMDELLPAPLCTVVANADDPVVVSAAGEANPVEWVSGEALWLHDFTTCPRCARVRPGC